MAYSSCVYNLFCRCYDAMVRCYAKMVDVFWSKHTISGGNKIHKEIAALICHQKGKLPFAAILGTGTLHRDSERCAHEGSRGHECNHCTCDGHAESIVYEGAPKYFMDQMVYLLKESDSESIFEKGEEHLKFRLKSDIKFYLMVTDPPCGFIQNQEEPCMEWKVPFIGFPHIPTCSSRILIGATMGIQGYVSHLLEKPIMIDSVIILCSRDAELQRTDFGRLFPLPKIKTRKYNSKDFASFVDQNLIRRKALLHSQPNSLTMDTSNSTPSENITATPNVSTSNGTKHGSLTVASPYKGVGPSYLAINPRTGKEIPHTSSLRTTDKHINACLNINKSEEDKRKAAMKKKYTDLHEKLTLKDALLKHKDKLKSIIKAKRDKMESWKDKASNALNDSIETADKLLQSTGAFNKKPTEDEWVKGYNSNVESKIHNIKEEMKSVFLDKEMISNIEDIVSNNKELIMDCSWHCYFRSTHDNNPTD